MIDFFSRLDEFMRQMGLNDNKLTVSTGISNGLIGKARKKGGSLSLDNISKILHTYSNLSADWLITGRGSMFKDWESYDDCTAVPVKDIAPIGSAAHVVSEQPAQDATAELIDKLLDRITEQAAEIGRQRELIHQMRQRFEKDAANASTGTIADVG